MAADAAIDGRRVRLDAKATAYGVGATAQGLVTVPRGKEPLSFDLRGRASHVDVARLPRQLELPAVGTDVTADYHAVGAVPRTPAGRRIDADVTFADSTLPGATIAQGSTAGVTVRGAELAYRANATVRDLDLQTVGTAFDVPALADPRYQSAINAQVTAEGAGTSLDALQLTAHGTISSSAVLGGEIPDLVFDATVAGDVAHLTTSGAFKGFNPATASGRPSMEGMLAGRLNADVTVEGMSTGFTADNIAASAQLQLEPSTLGGIPIESAALDADYRAQVADIRRLEVVGRDLNVTASGTLATGYDGASSLTVHADSPRLAEVGKLFDVPLAGIGKVDAVVTGNRSELQASGTLVGNGLKYQDNGALSVTTEFTARVPELSMVDARIDADTSATFVTLAGQNVNELKASTKYAEKEVDFTATAKQPERSLDIGGSVLLHTDHQEVHLTQLGLASGSQQWSMLAGAQPTINYAADAIAVERFELSNGAQQLTADGTVRAAR